MVIRQATLDDAELLSRLTQHVHELHVAAEPALFKPWTLEPLAESFRSHVLAAENSYVLIAFDNESTDESATAAGYVQCFINERPENAFTVAQRWLLVDAIAVLPQYQGRGVGRALAEAVLAYAAEQRIAEIAAQVWYFNEQSKAFFRALGFTQRVETMRLALE